MFVLFRTSDFGGRESCLILNFYGSRKPVNVREVIHADDMLTCLCSAAKQEVSDCNNTRNGNGEMQNLARSSAKVLLYAGHVFTRADQL